MRIPWADDRWFSRDKFEQHFPWAVTVWLVLAVLAQPFLIRLFAAIGAGVGIELVEWWRWRQWQAKLVPPQPQPWLCDRPSYRDLAWDAVGYAIAAFLVSRLRGGP